MYVLGTAVSCIILPPPENISWLRPCTVVFISQPLFSQLSAIMPLCFHLL